MTAPSKRRKGSGALFLRGDGIWVARITLPSPRGEVRRTQVTSRRFCDTLRKLTEIHPPRPEFLIPGSPRVEAMRAARERGQHTAREWFALGRSVGWRCHYCGIQCHSRNRPSQRATKDHRIPVTRGGSDAIDNIVVACKQCNSEKATLTDQEYLSMWNPRLAGVR